MNPFKIGVHLALHGHTQMGTALAALAGHFVGFHQRVEMTQQALNRFQNAFLGAGAAMVGWQGMKGMKHLVDDAGNFLKIQNQMLAGSWTEAELAKATALSWELSAKHRNVGAKEILEMTKELAPVLGGADKALAKAPMMAGFLSSMQIPLGTEMAKQFTRQIRDGIKSAELAGEAINMDRFAGYMQSMVKVLNAFGGTITPSDYFMATKYARASGLNWSDQYRELILPTIMQELGAASTGTAHMSLYQAIIGGMMRQKSLTHFDDLGMIDHDKLDPSNLTKEGRIKRMDPKAFMGARQLMENPYEWVQQTLLPQMIKKGIITQSGMDQVRAGNIKEGEGAETRKLISEYVAQLFQNRTAQGLIDMLALQPYKIERDKTWIAKSMGINPEMVEKDYNIAKHALKEQWDNFTTALGLGHIKEATSAINGLVKAISGITTAIVADPAIAKGLMTSAGVLLSALVLGGVALLGSAVLGAAAIPALGASIVAGLAVYIASHWKAISETAVGLGQAFGTFASTIAKAIGDGIMQIPGLLIGAISSMASGIASKIGSALSGLFGGGKEGTKGLSVPGETGIVPQSWVPPASKGQMIQASTQINLDGRVLARSVSQHIAEEASFVSSGAGYDGHMSPLPVDYVPV